jgi:plastocyanin domain-containing protein
MFNAIFVGMVLSVAHADPGASTAETRRRVELFATERGFEPDRIDVRRAEPLRLVVTRTTDKTCATAIVIKDLGIKRALPLNQPVVIDFTPTKTGELTYSCGMKMIGGVLLVQ